MTQKSHIWDSFFENIISGIQSFFLISDFLVESFKANKHDHVLQYSFAQKTSLILRTSNHLT